MQVERFEAGPILTNCYLAIDKPTKCAVAIDAPPESIEYYQNAVRDMGLRIEAVVLTHSHWDHSAEAKALQEYFRVPVYVHKDDEYRLLDPMKHTIIPLPFSIEPINNCTYINHGDKIFFGDLKLEVVHTPGHTEGSICLINHSDHKVFGGDTLFHESVGRVDLPGGSSEQIIESINNHLMTLPDQYIVYPGHGIETTIGHERNTNPFIVSGVIL